MTPQEIAREARQEICDYFTGPSVITLPQEQALLDGIILAAAARMVRESGAVGLPEHWRKQAADFHDMGAQMHQDGNMAGKEYMQTAACWRECAAQLDAALDKLRAIQDQQP